MSTILFLEKPFFELSNQDESSNTLEEGCVVRRQLEKQGVQLLDYSQVSHDGTLWPNLLKRCDAVLVSGLSGLVDDDPELDAKLDSFLSLGLYVQVFCKDRPISDISEALIGGIHYQFGIDLSSAGDVEQAVLKLLEEQPQAQFMA